MNIKTSNYIINIPIFNKYTTKRKWEKGKGKENGKKNIYENNNIDDETSTYESMRM